MKYLQVIALLCLFSANSHAQDQDHELISKTKQKELFTTESMDSILIKVELLRHTTEIVYFEWSEFTTLVIYPKINQLKKEGE